MIIFLVGSRFIMYIGVPRILQWRGFTCPQSQYGPEAKPSRGF